MKKANKDSNNKKSEKSFLSNLFKRKNTISDEFIQGNDSNNHQVRHIENPVPFLSEIINPDGEYGATEDVKDKWGLDQGAANVRHKEHKALVNAIIALVVLISVIVSVFYVLPAILPGLFKGSEIELFIEREVNLEYTSPSFRIVIKPSVSVYELADVTSTRLTEVLYNEAVVQLDSNDGTPYILIRTSDGIVGYIERDSVDEDMSSIEPDLHEYRLIVSERSKSIMTHTSQGTLITKVMMNTVLYADVKRDGVYQVSLPNGDSGWIGSSGVVEVGIRDEIEELSTRYFVSSALSLVNAQYLENGITMNGLSVNGIVYVCSCVNGVPMPRTIEEQAEMGQEVEMEYDVVSGELIIESILPGDILFLRSPYSSEGDDEIYEMAICTDPGTLLMISDARTSIRLRTFTSNSDICGRILSVRRIFS